MVICKQCNYNALSEYVLTMHIDYSHLEILVCCLCNYKAQSSYNLKTHIKKVHPDYQMNANIEISKRKKTNKEKKKQMHNCVFCDFQAGSEMALMCHEDKEHIVVQYSNQTSETSKVTNKKSTEKSEQKEMSSVIDVTTLNQGQNKKRKGKLNLNESNPKRAKSLKVTAHLEDREKEETGNEQENGDEEEKTDDGDDEEVEENAARDDNVEEEGLEGFKLVTIEDERCRLVTFLERERVSKEQKGEEDIKQKAIEQKQKEEEDRDKQAHKQKERENRERQDREREANKQKERERQDREREAIKQKERTLNNNNNISK